MRTPPTAVGLSSLPCQPTEPKFVPDQFAIHLEPSHEIPSYPEPTTQLPMIG